MLKNKKLKILNKLNMITIPLFVIALTVLFTLIYTNFKYSNSIIEEQVTEEYIQIIESKHDMFDNMLYRIISLINAAFNEEETLNLISGNLAGYDKSESLRKVREMLRLNKGFGEEYQLFYYGFNGITFTKSNMIFDSSVPFEETKWYRQAIKTEDKLYWFGLQPSELSEVQYSFIGSLKIEISDFKRGDLCGLAYISIDEYIMNNLLKSIGGITYIVNRDGMILYDTEQTSSGQSVLEVLGIDHTLDVFNGSKYNVKKIDPNPLGIDASTIAVISPWDNYGFSMIHVREHLSIINKYKLLQILYYVFLVIVVIFFIYCYIIFVLTIRKPIKTLYNKVFNTNINQRKKSGNFINSNQVSTGIKHIDDEFNKIMNLNKMNMQKISQIERAEQLMEIKKLQAEIDPHFLYNVLGHIKFAAMLEDPEQIITVIDCLFVMLNSKKAQVDNFISIKEEIYVLQKYIDIIEIIYQDNITFTIDIASSIENCKIPSFILQPIVENCVHHALNPSKRGGKVSVIGKREIDGISLQVIDNGRGIHEDAVPKILQHQKNNENRTNKHMGIMNIDKKIKLCCGDKYGISIESKIEKGTTITICLDYILP